MKRIMVAMTLMGAALVMTAGVAWAATVNCKVGVFCEAPTSQTSSSAPTSGT